MGGAEASQQGTTSGVAGPPAEPVGSAEDPGSCKDRCCLRLRRRRRIDAGARVLTAAKKPALLMALSVRRRGLVAAAAAEVPDDEEGAAVPAGSVTEVPGDRGGGLRRDSPLGDSSSDDDHTVVPDAVVNCWVPDDADARLYATAGDIFACTVIF